MVAMLILFNIIIFSIIIIQEHKCNIVQANCTSAHFAQCFALIKVIVIIIIKFAYRHI